MNTLWHIQLLGDLRACREGREIQRFRTRKSAALLARLAFAPHRSHPREELVEMLWPDSDFDAGRSSLRQALATLRRQLEPPGTLPGSVLTADRTCVRLNPQAVSTDVADFEAALRRADRSPEGRREHLAHALELYGGELLPGFYDEWLLGERERLAQAYARAKRQLDQLPATASVSMPGAAEPPPALPAERRLVNLPLQWTRFFGRETDLSHLAGLLSKPETRLVTLTGTGGAGKTRLAVEAARQAAEKRCGPICFVPLADLSDPALIPAAVAAALSLPRSAGADPLAPIVAALSPEPEVLLLLDNLEQFAEAAAPILLSLLTRLPTLTVLATSRTRLFLAGESEFPVPPLPLPPEEAGSLERLLEYPSVRLFVDRAQTARPDFAITPRSAPAVAALCRRLDGIPLALELSASWAQALTPAQMLSRLEAREALPVRRANRGPKRHQTLWATIAWGCHLLPPDLRRFWTRLSVFRGGWTADAAAVVCEEPSALFLLTQLQARSLVQAEDTENEMRWRMLETLREFAGEQLTTAERSAVAARHAAYFLRLAEAADPNLMGPDSAVWLDRLEADHDNLRTGLNRHLSPEGDADKALQMAAALWWFWRCHIHLREGRAFLEAALLHQTGPSLRKTRADALNGVGVLARQQRDYTAARRFAEEALRLQREADDPWAVIGPLSSLGNLLGEIGEYAESQKQHLEVLRLEEARGNQTGVLRMLNNLTNSALRHGDIDLAVGYNARSLTLSRSSGTAVERSAAAQYRSLIERRQGRLVDALASQQECIRYTMEADDLVRLCDNVQEIAALLCLLKREEVGIWCYACLNAYRKTVGLPQDADTAEEAARHLAAARLVLGDAEYERQWKRGEQVPLTDAVQMALEIR